MLIFLHITFLVTPHYSGRLKPGIYLVLIPIIVEIFHNGISNLVLRVVNVLTDFTNWTGTLWDKPVSRDAARLNCHASRKSTSSNHTPPDSSTTDYHISCPYTDHYYW